MVIAQYISARAHIGGADAAADVEVELLGNAGYVGPDSNAGESGELHRPRAWQVRVTIQTPEGAALPVRLRIPEWIAGEPVVSADAPIGTDGGFLAVEHAGGRTVVEVAFPFALRAVPIPDEPTTVAFVEGPIVLAGLCASETALQGHAAHPVAMLAVDNERQWTQWLTRYRTVGQTQSIRLIPLHEVTDERFSVYFPIIPGR